MYIHNIYTYSLVLWLEHNTIYRIPPIKYICMVKEGMVKVGQSLRHSFN